MRVIFTCGGTGGHINPAIAVANVLKERQPDCEILFIGAQGHMEEKLVPQAGYRLECLPVAGLHRGISPKDIGHNFQAAGKVISAIKLCRKLIREFQPDVILGTGGYASFPALYAGSRMRIPTCVHESNAVPGLTTKLASDRVDRVLVCFAESVGQYRHPDRVEVVGMPVRKEFLHAEKDAARRALGLGDGPVVVSAFGSQGARDMNKMVCEMLRLEQEAGFPFHHIHATGSFGWEWMPQKLRDMGVEPEHCPAIDLREYIYDMPQVMAAADVVIGRSGASTCNEISASGTPCVLIPSPNVTNHHQEKNARVLEERGGAVVIPEAECSGQKLLDTVSELLRDYPRRKRMSAALRGNVVTDSAERICDVLEELAAAARC